MSIVERAYNTVMPGHENIWKRSGATMLEVEIEPGRIERIPHHDIGVDTIIPHKPVEFTGENGRRIGRHIMHTVITSDGVDHSANLTIMDDRYRTSAPFFVSDSTALFTGVNGYAAVRDNEIAQRVGVDIVRTGADGSANLLGPLDFMRVGATALRSRKSSLAKSAEADQAIVAKIAGMYSLPPVQYGIGDSQAGMRKLFAHYFAGRNGIDMAYMDVTAICAPDKLNLKDLPEVGLWTGTELLGGAAIIALMLLEDEAEDITETISLNPNFITATIIGALPSLASGEAGASTRFVPSTAAGHFCHYGNDRLSHPERWIELLSANEEIQHKIVDKGIHAHLLRKIGRTQKLGRIIRFDQEFKSHSSIHAINYKFVSKAETAPDIKIAPAS